MNLPTKPKLPAVRGRIYGVSAVRLQRLRERTCVPMERLIQMAVECGLLAVEKRFR